MCCATFLHNGIYKWIYKWNFHFQIPYILTEDTTATTVPPAKAPQWHHQTPTTDKVVVMTSSICLFFFFYRPGVLRISGLNQFKKKYIYIFVLFSCLFIREGSQFCSVLLLLSYEIIFHDNLSHSHILITVMCTDVLLCCFSQGTTILYI